MTNVKKFWKRKKGSPETKVVFSGLIVWKDKKDTHKDVIDTNARLKNFFGQKSIDYSDTTNIKEDHLGVKKLHLNKVIQCFHKTLSGTCDLSFEKMLI